MSSCRATNAKCDVRGCVNPDHLYAGTHQDNMADRTRRLRDIAGHFKRSLLLHDPAYRRWHRKFYGCAAPRPAGKRRKSMDPYLPTVRSS